MVSRVRSKTYRMPYRWRRAVQTSVS